MTRPASRRFGAARAALILAVVCLQGLGILGCRCVLAGQQ